MVLNIWTKFVNGVFTYIIRPFVKFLISTYLILKMFWMPIYYQGHPTACAVIDWTNGKKTYIVSITAIIGLLYEYHKKAVDFGNLISSLPVLVVAMTIRHGLARHAATAENEVPPCPICPPEYDPNHN